MLIYVGRPIDGGVAIVHLRARGSRTKMGGAGMHQGLIDFDKADECCTDESGRTRSAQEKPALGQAGARCPGCRVESVDQATAQGRAVVLAKSRIDFVRQQPQLR